MRYPTKPRSQGRTFRHSEPATGNAAREKRIDEIDTFVNTIRADILVKLDAMPPADPSVVQRDTSSPTWDDDEGEGR